MIPAHESPKSDSPPYRLGAPSNAVWDMARVIEELRADDQTIRRWVREGKLPGPTLRRRGRALWDPADVEPFRRRRLHRIGAE
jgi:MerR HTH family regulatory protein